MAQDQGQQSEEQKRIAELGGVVADCFAMIKDLRHGGQKEDGDMKENDDLNVDKVIELLMKNKGQSAELPDGNTLKKLALKGKDILSKEGALVSVETSKDCGVTFVGPIAAHYNSLIKLFAHNGPPSEKNTYVFLGRYVNRGKQSLETFLLLLAYKIKYPKNVYLLRGNHECLQLAAVYGLYSQMKDKKFAVRDFLLICDCFDCLPFAAIVDKKIFCVAGGISPKLEKLDDIKSIKLPADVPHTGLRADLLWSDPKEGIENFEASQRGAGVHFGEKAVLDFCKKFGFDLIVRGMALAQNGYQEFGKEKKLVTLFGAHNYCGTSDNKAALLKWGNDGKKSFANY